MDVDPLEFVKDEDADAETDEGAVADVSSAAAAEHRGETERREADRREADRRRSRLNTQVAVAVALLATFTGICKVKDDNVVQAMQQAQADRIDQWSFYQARNIREEVAKAAIVQLELARAAPAAQAPAARAAYDSAITRYRALVADEERKKLQVRDSAVNAQRAYDTLNYRDDQFDLSDALAAIAISLLALTALTQKRWLFAVAMVATFFGVLMGLAGLAGWHLHPDALARWLS